MSSKKEEIENNFHARTTSDEITGFSVQETHPLEEIEDERELDCGWKYNVFGF